MFYRFGRGIWSSLKDPEFEALFSTLVITLGAGATFYHYNEGWSWLDSVYFSVTTLTTVGYGDFVPHTAAGKLFTIAYLFVGIGILLAFINYVAENAIEERKKKGFLPWRNKKSSQ
jgi:voltage-gated potassium channel